MKTKFTEVLPDTVAGLELFVKECDKEIKKYNDLRTRACKSLEIKAGIIVPDYFKTTEHKPKSANFRGNSSWQVEQGMGTSKEGSNA